MASRWGMRRVMSEFESGIPPWNGPDWGGGGEGVG